MSPYSPRARLPRMPEAGAGRSLPRALLAGPDDFPRAGDDPINHAVLDGLLRAEHVVAVGVALYLLDRLARHLRVQLVHPSLGPHELPGVDLHVRDLPAEAPPDVRLVQEYPCVGQRAP